MLEDIIISRVRVKILTLIPYSSGDDISCA